MDPIPASRPRTSVSSIASLVCGLLACIPFATGLAAVVLGIVGIRKTRDPMASGRGMAIVGLILGVLSLAGWAIGGAVGAGMYALFRSAEPARVTAEEFVRDLAEGKVDAAMALSVEGVDRANLVATSEEFKSWGAFRSLGLETVSLEQAQGQSQMTIGGTATFADETRPYQATLREVGGRYRVDTLQFP